MKEKVIDWIDKQQTPFHISYSMETDPLGTGGAIKKALRMLQSDEALILNGDTLFNIEIDRFYAEYKSIPSEISISLKPLERFNRYGNISVNSDHIVTTFHEKCFCEKGFVNGGIYLLSTKNTWMDNMPNRFSFETDILQRYVGHGSISGFIHDAYFIDIGIPEDYDRANNEFGKIFPV
jgi:D-glycero-alpha-D-manno-heptose 1-phosphate guanylyltransferase